MAFPPANGQGGHPAFTHKAIVPAALARAAAKASSKLSSEGDASAQSIKSLDPRPRLQLPGSTRRFVEEGIIPSKGSDLPSNELMAAYYDFCEERGWHPMSTSELNAQLPRHMLEVHKASRRHDLGENKSIRGYKHVRLTVNVGGVE